MKLAYLPRTAAFARTALFTALSLACLSPALADQPAASPDQRASSMLKRMSLQDMHHTVQSYNDMMTLQQQPGGIGAAGYVPALPKLGIPAQQQNDAGIGVHNYPIDQGPGKQPAHVRGEAGNTTPLPSTLAIAATWNPQIAYEGGRMIAGEAHAQGINVLLAGGVNLTREPRDGRTFEYLGEDPL